MEDAIERTLCQLPRVYVFRIPTRTSAGGYRAADWPKDPSWTGKLKVIAKGSLLAVVLMDDQNSTFAICNVTDDSCVERTADSGRYFVLKISNAQGRHAFIGIAFDERSDAFDFNVAISTFKTEMEREQRALSTASLTPQEPVDFSLKSGEKIKIKLNTKKHADASVDSPASEIGSLQPKKLGGTPSTIDPFGPDPFASTSDPFASTGNSDPFAT
eukprot:gene2577-2820_t